MSPLLPQIVCLGKSVAFLVERTGKTSHPVAFCHSYCFLIGDCICLHPFSLPPRHICFQMLLLGAVQGYCGNTLEGCSVVRCWCFTSTAGLNSMPMSRPVKPFVWLLKGFLSSPKCPPIAPSWTSFFEDIISQALGEPCNELVEQIPDGCAMSMQEEPIQHYSELVPKLNQRTQFKALCCFLCWSKCSLGCFAAINCNSWSSICFSLMFADLQRHMKIAVRWLWLKTLIIFPHVDALPAWQPGKGFGNLMPLNWSMDDIEVKPP